MTYYDTEQELMSALETKFRGLARRRLSWSEPYDEADFDEVWNSVVSTGGRRRRTKGQAERTILLFAQSPEVAKMAHNMAELTRSFLDLHKPIPLEKIREFFEKRQWVDDTTLEDIIESWEKYGSLPETTKRKDSYSQYPAAGDYFQYPVSNYDIGVPYGDWHFGIRFCQVDCLKLSANTMEDEQQISFLGRTVRDLSSWLSVHPALTLAMILSDMPVHLDWVTAIQYHDMFAINVQSPVVAPSLVRSVYSIARTLQVTKEPHDSAPFKWPRWRTRTERISTLLKFIESREEKDWNNIYREWNETHAQWAYVSLNSMRSVYYRAIALAKERQPEQDKKKLIKRILGVN